MLRTVLGWTCPEDSFEVAEMADGDQDDDAVYAVVVNHEEQYSIWPSGRPLPLGWTPAGKTGRKDECLAYIESVWTDMRPLSVRRRPQEAENTVVGDADDHERCEAVPSLVERLSSGQHPVEAALRPERSAAALKQCIDREYLHIRFVEIGGHTELCINVDKAVSIIHLADFENERGTVHLEGELTLNHVRVRCIVDLDVATLCGMGYLVPLAARSQGVAPGPR